MNRPLPTPRRPRAATVAALAFGAATMVAIGSALALRHQDAPRPAVDRAAQATGASAAAQPAPASSGGSASGGPYGRMLVTTAPGAAPGSAARPAAAAPAPGPDAAAMVARLEQRLRQQPQDREGWMMLARAYGVMGRDQEAVEVYRRIIALSPADNASRAQAHADLGRAIGKAHGRKLTPEADAELRMALSLDPANVMAHALLGRTSLEKGDAAAARQHWEKALEGVDSGHPFAQQLKQSIELADSMLKATGSAAGSAVRPAPAQR